MIRRVVTLLLAGALAACSAGQREGETVAAQGAKTINEVLAAHTDSLMALPGVQGTAIGLCDGERCIKVYVADGGGGDTRNRIPTRLEGYRVVVEVSGTIRPR